LKPPMPVGLLFGMPIPAFDLLFSLLSG